MTPNSPAASATPEVGTPGTGPEGSTPETPVEKVDQTPSMRSQQGLKTGSDKTAGTSQPQAEENAATDGQNGTAADSSAADSSATPSESASSPTQSSPSIKKRQQKRGGSRCRLPTDFLC